jgi:hypothetical protein
MLSVHLATDRSMNDTLNRLPLEARLVSAAPAMLEALKYAEQRLLKRARQLARHR